MSTPIAMRMAHVYKKFRRGEQHDSLRDLIPALARRAVRGPSTPPSLESDEFWALQDISFEIGKGESVAIIGHNGAGKSTMLKHLSGLMKPTRGTIHVNGRLSALIEVGAGFHTDLTGRENVYLNGVILGMSRAEIRSKFDEIVEFSGLKDFIDTPVKRYSSGMFARLGFSVAAHLEPDILIIDEVLSVGDFMFQAKGVEKMKSVLKNGSTVIFVSHNLKSVADLCKRSLLMSKGRILEDGPTSQVLRSYLKQATATQADDRDVDVRIESVVVYGKDGERLNFESGETAEIEVTIVGVRGATNVACILNFFNESFWEVFNTSSHRLGEQARDIAPGERRTFRFQVDLHLAPGTFHIGVFLYRYEISHVYDRLQPAATIVVTSDVDGQGIVQLNPRMLPA